MNFENAYNNAARAASYARLEYPNTYYLAYRDLPDIIASHAKGKRAVDFGCGTGRSTRFLKGLGFDVTGLDISSSMLEQARSFDPQGQYRQVKDGNYAHLGLNGYDLVLSVFTFDNIPGLTHRAWILRELSRLLKNTGKLILLDATPELYVNEWASFSTRDFPENKYARSGDIVRVIMNDAEDKRPVEDIFWTREDYLRTFEMAGLSIEAIYKPLGSEDEPYPWKMECTLAPWVIYVLKQESAQKPDLN